jgi:hypothetical protein
MKAATAEEYGKLVEMSVEAASAGMTQRAAFLLIDGVRNLRCP